uniref:Putative secreted protein n=1 Tax=Anopheles darlingi TaxID=43151 RepID=A0A2M4D6Q3_ANODA
MVPVRWKRRVRMCSMIFVIFSLFIREFRSRSDARLLDTLHESVSCCRCLMPECVLGNVGQLLHGNFNSLGLVCYLGENGPRN